MAKNSRVVIGTRGSMLALWQAEWIKAGLQQLHPGIEVSLNIIKTTGDKIQDVPLAKVGGKGLFVKEIEEALLSGEADIAVHSMKDVPAELPDGLHIPVICKREDPRDAFIARDITSSIKKFRDLPQGATVGTSSLRRSCQLLNRRPDLKIVQLRGNLDTRLRRLDEGLFDAIILAAAGVNRLGWSDRITEILSEDICLPAVAQGAVGIECRKDDRVNELIAPLNHMDTSICVRAERAFLRRLEGGCQVPIAGFATITSSEQSRDRGVNTVNRSAGESSAASIMLEGLVGDISGSTILRDVLVGSASDAEAIGRSLAERLLSRGAKKILDEVYGRCME